MASLARPYAQYLPELVNMKDEVTEQAKLFSALNSIVSRTMLYYVLKIFLKTPSKFILPIAMRLTWKFGT